MKRLAAALGAAALATAGSAAAGEILIFSASGTTTFLDAFDYLSAGDFRFEVTASRPIYIELFGYYTDHWDVFIAPPPRPHSEFVEGNSSLIITPYDTFGTSAAFSFNVPETEYQFFDSDSHYQVYGIPVGTPLYRERRYENPFFILQGYGDTAEPFDYSVRVFQSVVPEPATWALMILGFGAAGAALRRRSARDPTPSLS